MSEKKRAVKGEKPKIDFGYKIIDENEEKRTKVFEILCTGKHMFTRDPRFRDRDRVYGVIQKIQKKDKFVRKIVEQISRAKNVSVEDVYDMIESGEGLSEKDQTAINEATANTDINADDMEVLITSILNLNAEDKENFMEELSMKEGIAALKIAMSIYNESMVGEEERKK